MYKSNYNNRGNVKRNECYKAETIEQEVSRALNNGEKLEHTKTLIYTEKKAGTPAGYNIRTDRFEIALDAIETLEKSKTARREATMKVVKDDNTEPSGGPESVQGTNN